MAGSTVLSLLVCLVLLAGELSSTNGQPQVISKGGGLKFVSNSQTDIEFEPGQGGNLVLNGVPIKSAAELKGDTGPKGAAGAAGVKGDVGTAGSKGDKGDVGLQGPTGTAGRDGAKGDDGLAGAVGQKGEPGATGSQGPKGDAGVAGVAGVAGPTGAAGAAGADGKDGMKGAAGAAASKGEQGPPGPPGPPGMAAVSSGSQCSTSVLPSCPLWFNTNASKIAAQGNPVVQLATLGFEKLYNPSFPASYTCKFASARQSVSSADASLTLKPAAGVSTPFYVVNCQAPSWNFVDSITFTEQVNISLWHLDTTEILFSGRPAWRMATMFVTTYNFYQIPSTNQMNVDAAGLNTKTQYICRFTETGSSGVVINSAMPTRPLSPANITCPIPIWTAGSSNTVTTNVSLWTYESGKPVVMVPHSGTSNSYTFKRCQDGVKNGNEADVDCGGDCPACATGKTCRTDSDCVGKCDQTKKTCATICPGGFLYKGICLRSVTSSSSSDRIPSGCNAYQPSLTWGISDFRAICSHFGGTSGCNSIDYDADGGRCTNYRAVLAYESVSTPDVWVSRKTFSWSPTSTSSPNCVLIANLPGTIVYACQ